MLRWAQHNSLVCYCGMIQDMLGYEFYVGAYRDRDELPSTSPEPMDLKTASFSSTMNTFQFGEKDNLPCLVKIYDSPESDLKLNDVFEFIGVLTFDSKLAVEKDDNNELSNSSYDDALVYMAPNKASSASSYEAFVALIPA
ncbi:hypothetical protein F3Y22_tig00113725pilonHSYRG01751 [Hibiscus syriacus]|uniref:Uncharacterized protein n=1 Tax=Hibiscus syriacus TaxID=106335 RepID=A0A6A2WMU3_HIBSY|nr:hypothetical protein F3Y22_tig00113725pilonHSYRG01751 [Hibiscus syriacus]